jgi:hypothetical protein
MIDRPTEEILDGGRVGGTVCFYGRSKGGEDVMPSFLTSIQPCVLSFPELPPCIQSYPNEAILERLDGCTLPYMLCASSDRSQVRMRKLSFPDLISNCLLCYAGTDAESDVSSAVPMIAYFVS